MTYTQPGRRRVLQVLGAGALASAPIVSIRAQARDEVVLASVMPLSGFLAQVGEELNRGVQIAVDAINAKGLQVGGRTYQVRLRTFDDRSDAVTEARLVERAATAENAHFLIAGAGGVLAKAVIPVAQRMRLPVIAQWSNLDGVFEAQRGAPFLFGGMPPYSRAYDRIWELATRLEAPKVRTVAMISTRDELGVYFSKRLPNALRAAGLQHVHDELFPPGTQDFGSVIERCAQHKPDILLLNCYTPQIIAVFKHMQSIRYYPPVVIFQGPTRLYEALGPDMNGALVPSFWSEDGTRCKDPYIGTSADFTAAYRARFKNAPPDFVAARGAANVVTHALVAAQAGTVTDRQALLNGLRNFDGETFFSPVKFDATGLNAKGEVFASQFQKGAMQLVYPEPLRQASPLHPFPLSRQS